MIPVLLETLVAIDANEQALRAADAAWESAKWAFLMLIVTVGLLIGAFLAARYAKKTWEVTKGELDMARAAEREREARNVSAWLQSARSGQGFEVFVRNGNGAPVYDLVCSVVDKNKSAKEPTDVVRSLRYTALGPENAAGPRMHLFPTNPPERHVESVKRVIAEGRRIWEIWNGEPTTGGLAVELRFRDSAGRQWHRDWHGKLTEVQ